MCALALTCPPSRPLAGPASLQPALPRSSSMQPPLAPTSGLQRLESQRPGPLQTAASLAAAADTAVRRLGGGGRGGGGKGSGPDAAAALVSPSSTSTGGAGGALGGGSVLGALVGGGQGVGQALFPTPQGALRAALSMQRDASKQASHALEPVKAVGGGGEGQGAMVPWQQLLAQRGGCLRVAGVRGLASLSTLCT